MRKSTVALLVVMLAGASCEQRMSYSDWKREEATARLEEWKKGQPERDRKMFEMAKNDPAEYLRTYGSGVGDPLREVAAQSMQSAEEDRRWRQMRYEQEYQDNRLREMQREMDQMRKEQQYQESLRTLRGW